MKKLVISAIVIAIFAGCQSNPSTDVVGGVDSTGVDSVSVDTSAITLHAPKDSSLVDTTK